MLRRILGFQIDQSARIGASIFGCSALIVEREAQIGHLNFFRGPVVIRVGPSARIGNLNWITSLGKNNSNITIGEHAAITNRHYIDCQASIKIGAYTTVAGVRSTFISHQIDVESNIQTVDDIEIGRYCIVGSNCVVLPGTIVADCVVCAAGAVVRGKLEESFAVYAGVPARFVKKLPPSAQYFNRLKGYVS